MSGRHSSAPHLKRSSERLKHPFGVLRLAAAAIVNADACSCRTAALSPELSFHVGVIASPLLRGFLDGFQSATSARCGLTTSAQRRSPAISATATWTGRRLEPGCRRPGARRGASSARFPPRTTRWSAALYRDRLRLPVPRRAQRRRHAAPACAARERACRPRSLQPAFHDPLHDDDVSVRRAGDAGLRRLFVPLMAGTRISPSRG
jgi:hypothetical protein